MPSPLIWPASNGYITYQMQGNLQTEPFVDKQLYANRNDGVYFLFTYNSTGQLIRTARVKEAYYDFVILPQNPAICYVRKARDLSSKKMPDRGHSSIAQGQNVLAAGTIFFDKDGKMIRWENKSGHYYFATGSQAKRSHVKKQTKKATCTNKSPLLPMDKFDFWDDNI